MKLVDFIEEILEELSGETNTPPGYLFYMNKIPNNGPRTFSTSFKTKYLGELTLEVSVVGRHVILDLTHPMYMDEDGLPKVRNPVVDDFRIINWSIFIHTDNAGVQRYGGDRNSYSIAKDVIQTKIDELIQATIEDVNPYMDYMRRDFNTVSKLLKTTSTTVNVDKILSLIREAINKVNTGFSQYGKLTEEIAESWINFHEDVENLWRLYSDLWKEYRATQDVNENWRNHFQDEWYDVIVNILAKAHDELQKSFAQGGAKF